MTLTQKEQSPWNDYIQQFDIEDIFFHERVYVLSMSQAIRMADLMENLDENFNRIGQGHSRIVTAISEGHPNVVLKVVYRVDAGFRWLSRWKA